MSQGPGISILGTRGIPGRHGGFETFAERLSVYLASRGWRVTVYCQVDGQGAIGTDEWCGIRRVHVPVEKAGALGTMEFDAKSIRHLLGDGCDTVLTLGYNTAVFCAPLRLRGIRNIMNMDGLEWQRRKWGLHEKAWLLMNELAGCLIADHLIADHPRIADHLATRAARTKITMIPYGSDRIDRPSSGVLDRLGLASKEFLLVIARPEPENSILEIVQAFSGKPRGAQLVVLGKYDRRLPYHRQVLEAAGPEVVFLGAIYDPAVLEALRTGTRCYIHGHQVGGTNPSLVEALGAGAPVLAHDNPFNRWVAGQESMFFADVDGCAAAFDEICGGHADLTRMSLSSRERHGSGFDWQSILSQYETLLRRYTRSASGARQ